MKVIVVLDERGVKSYGVDTVSGYCVRAEPRSGGVMLYAGENLDIFLTAEEANDFCACLRCAAGEAELHEVGDSDMEARAYELGRRDERSLAEDRVKRIAELEAKLAVRTKIVAEAGLTALAEERDKANGNVKG